MSGSFSLTSNPHAGPPCCDRINASTAKPCKTVFSCPYDLSRHEDTIDNIRKARVRCEYCREEKTFSRDEALARHMRVHHPDLVSQSRRGQRHPENMTPNSNVSQALPDFHYERRLGQAYPTTRGPKSTSAIQFRCNVPDPLTDEACMALCTVALISYYIKRANTNPRT